VAGTKGYELGHFECLHAHCAKRSDAEFLSAVGFEQSAMGDFSDESVEATQAAPVPPVAHLDRAQGDAQSPAANGGTKIQQVTNAPGTDPTAAWYDLASGLSLTRSKKGWQPTAKNIARALRTPGWWRRIARDTFRDALMWAPWDGQGEWTAWTNEDHTRARIMLEAAGFEPMSKDLLRDTLHLVASQNAFDSAQQWLGGLKWDGVPRLARFMTECLGCAPTPYTAAVGEYLWTALAGRVLAPGCKADMVPIFISPQGALKSTVVEALVPVADFYTTMDLADRDADLARRMRGRLVAELVELRGFHGREAEELKAFVSQRVDTWVPKFQEMAVSLPRRFIMIGTGNKDDVLTDETGNRRLLPVMVGLGDVARISAWREQLWAEGAERFLADGVAWQAAEMLAKDEHATFMVYDDWQADVEHWLSTECGDHVGGGVWADQNFTTRDVLVGALGMDIRTIGRKEQLRVGKILRNLGYQPWVSKAEDKTPYRHWLRTVTDASGLV
jgi:predicted P-loop ATPase